MVGADKESCSKNPRKAVWVWWLPPSPSPLFVRPRVERRMYSCFSSIWQNKLACMNRNQKQRGLTVVKETTRTIFASIKYPSEQSLKNTTFLWHYWGIIDIWTSISIAKNLKVTLTYWLSDILSIPVFRPAKTDLIKFSKQYNDAKFRLNFCSTGM